MRRFKFEKVFNLRELGGYPTIEGITKEKVFLRSDSITYLTQDEIEQLKAYGLKRVIDLRHANEIAVEADPFATEKDVLYQNYTFDALQSHSIEELNEWQLSKLYIKMAENQEFIQSVFKALAQEEGVVLFHCSAGKDRTGVIASILLKLVGVDLYDIVSDYQVSKTYLYPKYHQMVNNPNIMYASLYDSKPETMFEFMEYLDTNYENIEAYLISKGISENEILKIKDKFLDKQASLI